MEKMGRRWGLIFTKWRRWGLIFTFDINAAMP
jgi:hypothetical protein